MEKIIDALKFGVVIGVLVAALFFAVFWHIGESVCQAKHDVADCQVVLIPVEKDQHND